MASVERDVAEDISSTDDNHTRAKRNLSTARSDKAVFTSLHNRERITFAKKDRDGGENPTPGPGRGSGRGNWMSGKGMRLGEAFQRTDPDGNIIPRLSVRSAASSGSRIPRTKSFSPPGVSPSPSSRVENIQKLQERDKRSVSAPVDSESESTSPLQGSPSPAARNRRSKSGDNWGEASQTSPREHVKLDGFDRKMQQYQDDQERFEVLRSYDSPPLFSRARVGPRVEETTRTLAEKTSVSSFENEPPVRVPKTWGSKANKNRDWMAKILSPDASLEIKDHPEDVASLERQRAGADIPLPSVEDIASMQTLTPPTSRPASARPTNMSPEKSQMWNADVDFTAQSLQISTSPQLRVKPTKLDEIRSREIESLTARAVATNRLEEIREKISEERSIADITAGLTDPRDPDSKVAREKSQVPEERMSTLERNGNPITTYGTKVTSSKTGYERGKGEMEEGASQSEGHDETWETLRALSRVLTSKSPSPPPIDGKQGSKQLTVAGPSAEEKAVERKMSTRRELSFGGNGLHTNSDTKRNSGTSTPPKSDVDPEERIAAEARLFELQDNRSERNSIRVPSRSPSPSERGNFDYTPRPKIDPLLLPTPRVTGAFIETPAPSSRKPRKSRSIPPSYKDVNATNDGASSSDRIDSGRSVSETSVAIGSARRRQQQLQNAPSRPSRYRALLNTAKPTTVSEDLQRLKLEAQLDDSTLEDFDAILEAHTRDTVESENSNTILEPILDLEYDERGVPLTAKEIARRVEILTLDRMSKSIKNTSSSIRDARHGIERLEHQVSSSSLSTKEKGNSPDYIRIPLPHIFISSPAKQPGILSRNWRFTWFGLILAIFFSWLISETVMCTEFCHVNQSMNPIRSSYRDPFFPWAIPTKVDQWTGEIASNIFWDAWVGLGGERPSIFGKTKPCDWWLGRDGPIGLVSDENFGGKSIFSDEMI
jgi:hypothetical protein